METLTSNQAKTQFGDLLMKVQRSPVEISRNGKPVAVILSIEDYAAIEELKIELLQQKILRSRQDLAAGKTHDGAALLDAMINGDAK